MQQRWTTYIFGMKIIEGYIRICADGHYQGCPSLLFIPKSLLLIFYLQAIILVYPRRPLETLFTVYCRKIKYHFVDLTTLTECCD